MRSTILLGVAALAAVGVAQPIGGQLDYMVGDTKCQGYLAYDMSKAVKRPGVLIIHDWNGIDAYEEGRAMQLAKMGYVALCADIYGKDSKPKNQQESGQQSGKYKADRRLYRERLAGALAELKRDPNVDPNRIAVIGYCFGGTGALEMARAGMDVKGVVSFHGGLDAAEVEVGPIKSKVLICHGADDPFVPADQVEAFKKEFGGADMEFVSYPGAVHAFTEPGAGNDPSKGAAFNKAAAEDSWAKMKAFLAKIFS